MILILFEILFYKYHSLLTQMQNGQFRVDYLFSSCTSYMISDKDLFFFFQIEINGSQLAKMKKSIPDMFLP